MSKIVLVTTPIGNLSDITLRAKEHLEKAKYLICEDTRVTKSLLNLLGISSEGKLFESLNDHSSSKSLNNILNKIKNFEEVVLVSDAGSPVVCDPAYPLIKLAQEHNIEIDSAPGVCSVIAALEISGLPTLPFTFHGFLPRTENDIKKLSKKLSNGTHVFFDSPNRVKKSALAFGSAIPDSKICLVREITKKFQTKYIFSGKDVADKIDRVEIKGEFVLIVNIDEPSRINEDLEDLHSMALDYIENRQSKKGLSKILAKLTDKNAKEIYKLLVE